jgi:choline-sulfatase
MLRRIAWCAVLAAALFPGACSRSGKEGAASGLNLLVITLDTTRADALGLYGNPDNVSPNIDRLGREGVVFEKCATPAPLTLPAHCSFFTGLYPIAHKVRNNGTYVLGAEVPTLAGVFKAQGYRTAGFIASFILASKFGLSRGFDVYDEDLETGQAITSSMAEITADRVYQRFARWLDASPGPDSGDGKFFCWVHFYDPHAPYVRHDDAAGEKAASLWGLYEGEVRYVDAYVGRIVDALKSKGLLERTLIVIAGDHGEAFGEHKESGHGIFCYEESLRVPLIFYNTKVFGTPRRVAERVSLVDVMPTVLELFKIRVPPVQGIDLTGLMNGDRRLSKRAIYFESMFGLEEFHWAPLTGIIDGDRKYISLPEPELYDLPSDGRETNNLAGRQPEAARGLDTELAQFVARHAATGAAVRRDLTAGDVEKLKALGYVSSFSPKSGQATDPKEGIGIYLETSAARLLLDRGNLREAEARLSAILARNPGLELPDVYVISYEIARKAGRIEQAVDILQKAILLFPELESFKLDLAMTYIESGDLQKAREFCLKLLAENDQLTGAQILLGNVEDRLGNVDAALASYEKAAALEPQNGVLEAKIAGVLVEKGDLAKARAILEGLEARPDVVRSSEYAKSVSDLGASLLAAGEIEGALDLYKKAAALNPQSPAAWVDLGSTYFRLKRYDLALENYEKALGLDKDFALALSNSGIVYLAKSGEENNPALAEKALGLFDRAIRIQPGLAAAYGGRASARLVLNQTRAAIGDYEQAIRLDPKRKDAYINISIALREQGRYAEALKYLDAYKEKFSAALSPADLEAVDQMIARIKALKGRR